MATRHSDPPPEVLAAIIAAVEVAWPRPVVVVPKRKDAVMPSWRFSGRTWGAPIAVARARPSYLTHGG